MLEINADSTKLIFFPIMRAQGYNAVTQAETTLPFFLGAAQDEVETHLGQPSSSRTEFEEVTRNYPIHGICLKFKEDKVVEIQVNGEPFEGKILGLKVGESIEPHRPRLGPPSHEKEWTDTYILTWSMADFFLQVEVWRESGNDEYVGEYHKDHIRNVTLKSYLLTPEDERARCAEIFHQMFPSMSPEEIEGMLFDLEQGKSEKEE